MNRAPEWRFSHRFKMTRDEYVQIHTPLSPRTRWLRRILVPALGVVMLFWSYTLLIGAIILGLFVVVAVVKIGVTGTQANQFARSKHLHDPIEYRVDANGLEAESGQFKVWSTWSNLFLWRVAGSWLVLQGHGLPAFYFKVEELQAAGVWKDIERLMRRHGVEYDSEEANRLHL